MNIKFFFLLAILSIPIQCFAFEGWEHQRLGDLSYHIAKKIYCKTNSGTPFCSKDLETALQHGFFDPFTEKVPEKEPSDKHQQTKYITYGKLIMCVDYFLSLEKLLSGAESNLIQASEEDKIYNNTTGKADNTSGNLYQRTKDALLPKKLADLDFPVGKLCNTSYFNFAGARAGHINHSHFQAELLTGQKINHLLAISLSAIEKNLLAALATNAYSDHFLHDSFAPGHMITWRSRMTDTAANAAHDYHNRNGITICINGNDIKKFLNEKNKIFEINEIADYISSNSDLKEHFFDYNSKDECRGNCKDNNLQGRIDAIKNFSNDMKNEKTESLDLKGDFKLWNIEQDRQRFIMLIVQIRSILDILENFNISENPGKTIVNSFSNNQWKWQFIGKTPPSPFIPVFEETISSNIEAKIGPVEYMIKNRIGKGSPTEQIISYADHDRIWGLSAGVDYMTFGDPQNRKVFNFETLVGAKIHADSKGNNFALTLGAQYYAGTDSNGFGLTSRGIWVFPQTETAFSLQVRALNIQIPNSRMVVRPSLSLRMDLGFTSFLTNYLQVSWDHAVQKDGRIRRGMSIGGGIQLVAPTCRIPVINRIGSCQ